MAVTDIRSEFGDRLRHWRQLRKVSQLDLSLDAEVSQRHLSWLETGKSQPSRQMVIQLAEALDIPLRARNELLSSAGFAPVYAEAPLDAQALGPVYEALRMMMRHHEPFPAMVLDRLWRIVMINDAATRLFGLFGDMDALWAECDPGGTRSIARLTLHRRGLRPFIANWHDIAPQFLQRVRRDALFSGTGAERREYQALLELVDAEERARVESRTDVLPVLPLVLEAGGVRLSLFSVISTFGTPYDVTVEETRIESFFPTDAATREFFEALAQAGRT